MKNRKLLQEIDYQSKTFNNILVFLAGRDLWTDIDSTFGETFMMIPEKACTRRL